MKDDFTVKELSEILWDELPDYQHQANYKFLEELWRVLKEDGYWMWPETGALFKKTAKGFMPVNVAQK